MSSLLIGKKAPQFKAQAVANGKMVENFSLDLFSGKYVVLFFYPLDFTFVCPSEILAFDHRHAEFAKRHTRVVAVSVDSQFTHLAWKNTPVNKGGIGNLHYPMAADLNKNIGRSYGVLHDEAVALRGTFLIDREFKVRHFVINDLPLGRNVDETIRMVDALQFFEKHGEVCPAGWEKGKPGMKASAAGVADYLAQHGPSL